MSNALKPIQTRGMLYTWKSPDRTFHHLFLELDSSCELDLYPGIVIVADEHRQNAMASSVENLRAELTGVLGATATKATVHWSIERNERKRAEILTGLTEYPVFYG